MLHEASPVGWVLGPIAPTAWLVAGRQGDDPTLLGLDLA